ncbi:hypothetical protein R5R35_011013 [Gryllus longicercus]|uniref:Transcriptional adapter 3 n=1 Tax=Gryllus longicercus TaxID=2509291 RepID=A0AAN9YVJ3_9ORTH
MMPGRMKVSGKKVGRPKDSQKNSQERNNHDIGKHSLKGKHNDITKIKTSQVPGGSSSKTENVLTFPLLKTIDRDKMLPRYSAVLSRSDEEGVLMDDLDALQMELEALLSAVVVRSRVLQKEINTVTNNEEKHKRRGNFANRHRHTTKINVHNKRGRKLKESKLQDLGKAPVGIKFTKVKSVPASISSSANICLPDHEPQKSVKHDSPRLLHSRYDLPNKFWASVDSYCGEITRDDIRFLEELAKECESGDEYQKIPPLGRHYSRRWADEDMKSEQEEGRSDARGQNKGNQLEAQTLLKKGEKASEVSSGPLTQRLVSTLIEENVKLNCTEKLDSKSSGGENVTPRSGLFRTFITNNTVNFDRKVRKELEDQGILENNDQPKESCVDDEILQEIKRCQTELQTLNDYNHMHLKRLISLAEVQITRQELKRKLHRVDCDIMESYRNVVAAKQQKKVLSKTEQDMCWKALREREALLKQLDCL